MFESINDTIVSSDVAKLLKKKGFNKWCGQCYTTEVLHKGEPIDFDEECELKDEGYGDEIEYIDGGVLTVVGYCNKENSAAYAAPTQSVAMKWLREEKHYYIQVMLDSWACGGHLGYYVVIQRTDSDFEMMLQDAVDKVFYETYEEACEAAIKYTLEKLID